MCERLEAVIRQEWLIMALNELSELIRTKCTELGITDRELVERAGYRNIAKGLRRLADVRAGRGLNKPGLVARLPEGLGVPPDVVAAALQATRDAIWAENDRAYRESFRPHALIRTEHGGRPRSITMAALTGKERLVRVYFEEHQRREDYVSIAVASYGLRRRELQSWYFPARDIVVNYSPDEALRISLQGEELERLEKAERGGTLGFSLPGSRTFTVPLV